MVCDRRPLMSTTKPTPQASCSWAGSYRPAAAGRFGGTGLKSVVVIAYLRWSGSGSAPVKNRGEVLMPQPEAEVKCNINIRAISKRDIWAGGAERREGQGAGHVRPTHVEDHGSGA